MQGSRKFHCVCVCVGGGGGGGGGVLTTFYFSHQTSLGHTIATCDFTGVCVFFWGGGLCN